MNKKEQVTLTNMCMIIDKNENVVIQERKKQNWKGFVFPGGHIEKLESIYESVQREVLEETGLHILNPKLCGLKQFWDKEEERYIVFLFKATEFVGELQSSLEGEVQWVRLEEIRKYQLAENFDEMLDIFLDDDKQELYYDLEFNPAIF